MNGLNPMRPSDPELAALLVDFPTRVHPSGSALMDEEEVARVLQLAEIAGIPVVVDGGWAVDALLGWQTRDHSDLDLAINQQYLPRLLNILRRLDYQYLPRGMSGCIISSWRMAPVIKLTCTASCATARGRSSAGWSIRAIR